MKVWTDTELQRDRRQAIDEFVQGRLREPLDVYLEEFDGAQAVVTDLLKVTLDLTLLMPNHPPDELRQRLLEIVTDDAQFYAFRYLAGPPISRDDLLTVSDVASIASTTLQGDLSVLDDIARTVIEAHDRRRFPWLVEDREPTPTEHQAAIIATAALIAYQKYQTWRRSNAGNDQEDLVAEALIRAGFTEVPRREVTHLADAPLPGQFCRESKLRNQKADLLIGLWDRRTMPVECKVSNSSVNSYKRLNREAGGKARQWLHDLGVTQVAPASVLSGVYAIRSLRQAQDEHGLSLFWTHNLDALTDWIETTRP